MADITQTATSVVVGTGAQKAEGIAGGTVAAGNPVYKDSADSDKLKAADANASTAAAAAVGIALNGGASGQPIEYQTSGNINLGATLAVGTIYVVSANAGGIAPSTDLAQNWRTTVLGVATSSSILKMGLLVSGATVP